MRDFSTKQTFVGISLGNQSSNDTGVAILNKNLKIVTLDKLYTLDDIIFFLNNLNGKEDVLCLISMADNAVMLSHKWKYTSKKYQLVQTTGNIKNVDDWQERFSARGAEYFATLKSSGYDLYRYEIADIKMKLGLGGLFKSRSPQDCKFMQNVLKTRFGLSELPSNMIPVSQLEAILGAIAAYKVAQSSKLNVMYNYKGLEVLTLSLGDCECKVS